MSERQRIGTVFTYFSKVGVAGIVLEASLRIGDTIAIEGHTTKLEQRIDAIQIDRKDVDEAGPGAKVGIKTTERVRPHDIVYRVA